jgi:ATP-binding cassette subfamily B protein
VVQFLGLAIFTIFGALAEMVTIAAVVPFLGALLGASGESRIAPELFSGIDLRDLTFILIVAAVVAALIRGLLSWSTHRYTAAIGIDLSRKLYSVVLSQPYEQHISRNSSEVIAGFDKISGVVSKTINPLLQGLVSIVMVLGILIVLFSIDATVALGSILSIGSLYLLMSLVTRSSLTRNSKIIADSAALCIRSVQEGLGGIRDIILDNTQNIFIKHYSAHVTSMRVAQASNAFVGESPRFLIEAAGMIVIVLIAWGVTQRGDGAQEAIPIMGALALGAQKLLPAMQRIYFAWSSIRGNSINLVDILALLEEPQTGPQPRTEVKPAVSDKNAPILRLTNITYRYSGAERPVFTDLSIEIEKGDRIGIVGKTGSGKSTLADIAMGLLQPLRGQIYVHGELLTSANRRAWQSVVAHVPQFIYLADCSIAENIAFGVDPENIDFDLLKNVIEKAQLVDVVQNLNGGVDAVIGERGVKLSGGQRQRLGIARALYKQPEFLLLDEATSALDGHTEKDVMEVIEALGRGITIVIIAHRLSTLANCNKLIELDASGQPGVRYVDEALRAALASSN